MNSATQIGIAAAAVALPAGRRSLESLCQEESVSLSSEVATRLGVTEVRLCDGEVGSVLALTACQEALQRAELDVAQLDIILDYTILPQEYLVPAWNMSNKLQHELGAKKAMTVGFSGGGATNFLVALNSAAAMLATNEKFTSALLVAADVTIPGNRVLHPPEPVSILGDAAGAMVLKKGATGSLVLDHELRSDGSYHDVCYIPGGALANPDDPALYRMVLDRDRYDQAPKTETLQQLLETLLERNELQRSDIDCALYPNLSRQDRDDFTAALGFDRLDHDNLRSHGHLQGTDFVLNYLTLLERGGLEEGRYFIAASHGMGFLAGVTLLRV